MRFAAETRIQHLISRGRQVTVVKNDARDGWNGTKKVMNCLRHERLLSRIMYWKQPFVLVRVVY
jgi:hypothetical protein